MVWTRPRRTDSRQSRQPRSSGSSPRTISVSFPAGILHGTAPAWIISLVATSLLFGWGHGGQGLSGMAQESLSGLLLGVLYLACGRNLTVPIIAHGVSNTVAFILIFFGRYPGV